MDRNLLNPDKSWRLNERHYGDLEGLNKTDSIQQFGKENVYNWRRKYTEAPPLRNFSVDESHKGNSLKIIFKI